MVELRSRPTVLLVDDEAHVVLSLDAALTSHGFRVKTAPNGSLALQLASESRPDVVLLDLVLPGLDGVEVTRRLRGWSQVPIIVLSARGEERYKVRALDAGADDYVTKPFGLPELLARLRAALRRRDARRDEESVITMPGLAVDLLARRIEVDGREVHLTPTEFELMRLLVTNPDRVLTHRQILSTVLGDGYETAVQNLRTFIAQLRRKVERNPSLPRLILSEPGIGYRFRPPSTIDSPRSR